MPIPKPYFELNDVTHIGGRTWLPLRQCLSKTIEAKMPNVIELDEWSGIATAAINNNQRDLADNLQWSNGLNLNSHRAGMETWGYYAADVFHVGSTLIGINLVIDHYVEEEDYSIWNLHPDLVVALDLVREGDRWYRPKEGWVEVVRLSKNEHGGPKSIEIKAEFLNDYLTARDMSLYCSSYYERKMVTSTKPDFGATGIGLIEDGRDTRELIVTDAKYPHTKGHFWVRGALWRTEWLTQGNVSPRVRGDPDLYEITFALANDGTRTVASALDGEAGWLYFDPKVVATLLEHRGGKLSWYTQETGSLGATSFGVHFGINELGLITVYAKDIGQLPPWEQRIWSACNKTPEGGVSAELFAAQMQVKPASTVAPESDLLKSAGTTRHYI